MNGISKMHLFFNVWNVIEIFPHSFIYLYLCQFLSSIEKSQKNQYLQSLRIKNYNNALRSLMTPAQKCNQGLQKCYQRANLPN